MPITAINKHFIMLILLAGTLLLPMGSVCMAGGGQHYPHGSTDFVIGALPPAGTYMETKLAYTRKDRLADNSGNRVPVDFSADVFSASFKVLHVTPYTIFGGSWAVKGVVPFFHAEVELSTPGGTFDAEDANVGDMVFSPLLLGWHRGPNFHYALGIDIVAPTGNYDSADKATQILSRNHWTFMPLAAFTYLYKGVDFSAKVMYDLHTKNDEFLNQQTRQEVDLEPGEEFHFDWAVGYAPKEGLRLGLVGYNYWQTTDDKIDGVTVQDGKSRLGGVGVGIKYWPQGRPFCVTFKHYWEYGARNIAEGQSSQLKISCKF